jgi:hypothetical protein
MTTFSVMESKLLPAPFATDCIDYERSEQSSTVIGKHFPSRASYHEECISRYSMKYFGIKARINGLRLDAGDPGKTSPYMFKKNIKNQRIIANISDMCDSMFRKQDCHQIVYTPMIKSTNSAVQNETTFLLYLPKTPSIVSESSAKINFESFVTDLCSTFGFWLGLSVMSFQTPVAWVQRLMIDYFTKTGRVSPWKNRQA